MINSKYYIGKHQTNDLDDGYMGSGKLIKRAIAKYGLENFTKEILFVFDNEAAMNAKEAELVVIAEVSYNLCAGGQGGFGYINEFVLSKDDRSRNGKLNDTYKENWFSPNNRAKAIAKCKERHKNGLIDYNTFSGKTHSDETKRKISDAAKTRTSHSQTGTMWITDGSNNRKIRKDLEAIPEGWSKGRNIFK